MAPSVCGWGILGTATIARKNWQSIRNAENSRLVAVASRTAARAQQFIAECQAHAPVTPAPAPCGTYAELLARDDIDAVYIPLPTGLRKDWVIRAAEAGKHILCEKPCGVTSADLRVMLDACRVHKVQFMDGVMFMHSKRLSLLRQTLDDKGTIGNIHRIVSQFSFKASADFLATNIRTQSELEPLGCLGDLGWYNIRLSLWAMNEQLPERVSGRILAQKISGGRAVPLEFSGELLFGGGASASFFCSFLSENQQWANVSGTEGSVHMPDFVLPFFGSESSFEVSKPVFHVRGCDFNMEGHTRRFAVHEYSNSMANSQETNMVRTIAEAVVARRLEPKWGEQALKTQQVVDAALRSAGQDGAFVPVV